MNPITQTITLAPIEPVAPFVVCDSPFIHTLSVVEREVANIAITDAQSAQAAGNLLQRLTAAGKRLEETRTLLKAPLLAKGREIDDAARAPATRIEQAKNLIKLKTTAWSNEQDRLAREAEIARQKEIARLEALRKAEEAAAKKAADELEAKAKAARDAAEAAGKKPMVVLDDDDEPAPAPKTETQKALEAVKSAPVAVVAKPVGVTFKTTLRIEKIDVAKLPDMFVNRTANETAIRATYCTGYKYGAPIPECAGVTFRVHREPVSTGRDEF